MLEESARAVDKDMVGKDSEGVLMGGVPEFRNACSCALLAASSAAAAVCASLPLGDVEKNCAILLALAEVDLTILTPFSFGDKDGQGVGGELLEKGFESRRGMATEVYDICARGRTGETIVSLTQGVECESDHCEGWGVIGGEEVVALQIGNDRIFKRLVRSRSAC